jgi:hypothetical protein
VHALFGNFSTILSPGKIASASVSRGARANGSGVSVLPFHHPWQLAEQRAMDVEMQR